MIDPIIVTASGLFALACLGWTVREMYVAAYWRGQTLEWRHIAHQGLNAALALQGRLRADAQLRSARARHARQCQIEQRRRAAK